MKSSPVVQKSGIVGLILLVLGSLASQSTQAQQIQARPSHQSTNSKQDEVNVGLMVVGGVLAFAGSISTEIASTLGHNGNRWARLGMLGFPAMAGGVLIYGSGENANVDIRKMVPRLLKFVSSENISKTEEYKEIQSVESLWKSMLRQCRVYVVHPGSTTARTDIEGAASIFDLFASLPTDRAKGLELCKYLERVDERATLAKQKNASYERAMADDLVGRKLSDNDAVIFRNLFVLAGVKARK